MKKFILLFIINSHLCTFISTAQNVGIGTTTPAFRLDVKGGSINTDSFYRINNAVILSNEGYENLFIGFLAGKTGMYNCFTGAKSGYKNSTGISNSFYGTNTGTNNTSGSENVAIGDEAGYNLTSGRDNTFVGAYADCGAVGTVVNSAAIGSGASVSVSNTFVFGNLDNTGWGFGVASGSRAIKVGFDATNGNGAYLTKGGVWTDVSARNKKEDFTEVNTAHILSKINKLEITKWKYINTNEEYHIGPMADQFHKLFNIGSDSSLSSMDKSGVALLGIQELSKENKFLKQTVALQKNKIDDLEKRLVAIEQKLK